MSRRILKNRNIRKLSRVASGKSVTITLPIEYVRALKWQAKQKVVVTKKGKTLIIKDWKK